MAEPTAFDKIVDGSLPSFKVWEDADHMAFLSIQPSTPGMTVVIPKKNPGPYVFDMPDEDIAALMAATKKVVKLLEKAYTVPKVAAVFEGEGVPYVHVKLYPMHGIETGKAAAGVHYTRFYKEYPGYIDTGAGPLASNEELAAEQKKIVEAGEQ